MNVPLRWMSRRGRSVPGFAHDEFDVAVTARPVTVAEKMDAIRNDRPI